MLLDYGNMGCRVFKGGIQNYKNSLPKINILIGKYSILYRNISFEYVDSWTKIDVETVVQYL